MTHKERSQRRAAIITDLKNEININEIVDKYGLTYDYINRLRKQAISFNRFRDRNEKIIDDIKMGLSITDIATKYSLTESTIMRIARNSGCTQQKISKVSSFKVLKLLLDNNTQYQIAQMLNMTHQNVSAIAKRAREAGFAV